jgi:RNA polymerase sigma factor FliA
MRPKAPPSAEILVAEHQRIIRTLAAEFARALPKDSIVQMDDLVSAGSEGLLRAIHQYDPERHTTFSAYAKIRIRFAMIDALRGEDPLAPKVRAKARQVQEAIETLRQRFGRKPSLDEIRIETGLDERDIERATHLPVVSIDIRHKESGEPIHDVADSAQLPDEAAMDAQIRRKVRAAVESLPGREKLLIQLYYEHGLRMREIGYRLNVNESRVSQMHKMALERLRETMTRSGLAAAA